MILSIFDWLNETFSDLEDFVLNHYENPILWIAILVVILSAVALAANVLSNKR